jgi:hypothetical protein
MEDDTKVSKAINEVQEYYEAQDRQEWVEWAGKILMPCLHVRIEMERADVMRAEQEEEEQLWRQGKRAWQEQEQADKEAELDEKEVEYIRQVNAKEINEQWFWELVGELDLERAIKESMAKGPPTTRVITQDKDVGKSSMSWWKKKSQRQQRQR